MSDETSITPKSREDSALYVHYCEHPGCMTWGSFGVGKAEPNGSVPSIGRSGSTASQPPTIDAARAHDTCCPGGKPMCGRIYIKSTLGDLLREFSFAQRDRVDGLSNQSRATMVRRRFITR